MRGRRMRLSFGIVLALLALLALWTGCASTVTPPSGVGDPVTVHLTSAGKHAGLLLPRGDGRAVEYGYGAWSWYALNRDEWWRAPGTVLWPNRGTLGRRDVRPGEVQGRSYGGATVSELRVSAARATALLRRLDEEFEEASSSIGEPHYNEPFDMHFVPHPERFWFGHMCHDEVAEWLRELGCEVSRTAIRTGLGVRDETPAR